MIFDLRSETPHTLGLNNAAMDADSKMIELLRTAASSTDEWVTFLHSNARRVRKIYPNMIVTYTGIYIRKALRREKVLHQYIRPSTVQHDNNESTSVRLRKLAAIQPYSEPALKPFLLPDSTKRRSA